MEVENVAYIFGSTLFRSVICYPGKVIHLKMVTEAFFAWTIP